MTEEQIRIEVRLGALEFLAAHLLFTSFRHFQRDFPSATLDDFRILNDGLRKQFSTLSFPDMDPAMSDLWSAETGDAFAHILSNAEKMLATNDTLNNKKPS